MVGKKNHLEKMEIKQIKEIMTKNNSVFIIPVTLCLLLVHRNTVDFWMWILYHAILVNHLSVLVALYRFHWIN